MVRLLAQVIGVGIDVVEIDRFESAFDRKFYASRGLARGVFFPREAFGRDVLVPTDRPLTGADLRRVRFTVGLRGYRAAEVDALLARLADELDGQDTGAAGQAVDEPAADAAPAAADD